MAGLVVLFWIVPKAYNKLHGVIVLEGGIWFNAEEMGKQTIYNRKNVLSLTGVFLVLFWLVYSISSFLYEKQKIQEEIEAIEQTNRTIRAEIETKKKELEYLKTPQRIEKEAKMQRGKRRPNERVIVFLEEELPFVPEDTEQFLESAKPPKQVPIWRKWQWVLWGHRGTADK